MCDNLCADDLVSCVEHLLKEVFQQWNSSGDVVFHRGVGTVWERSRMPADERQARAPPRDAFRSTLRRVDRCRPDGVPCSRAQRCGPSVRRVSCVHVSSLYRLGGRVAVCEEEFYPLFLALWAR